MASSHSLGGVTSDEVQDFARAEGAPPTEAGASLTSRFCRRVSDLVVSRIAKGENGPFTIFLKSEAILQDIKCCDHIETPLLANGQDTISGKVWLSTASLASAYELLLTWTDQSTLFQTIRGAGLGHTPALVIDWRPTRPLGTLFREGLNQPETIESVLFEEAPITIAEMKSVLDRFYERSLRTPALVVEGHATRIWKEAAKGIPEHRPEEKIQGRLTDILKSWFSRHEVRAEPVTQDGRADIVVYTKALTQQHIPAIVNEWVLELKALCDMTNTGNSVPPAAIPEAVKAGLEQVIGYRVRLNAVNGAVCCYDMQKEDQGDECCFNHVREPAANCKIQLWRWYVFRSTDDSRAARNYLSSTAS